MMASTQQILLDSRQIDRLIQKVVDFPDRNFVSLSRVAELDPARDLRFHDWSGVDFSGCDLSGYDFTGADLRGCCFDGAWVAGAIFDRANVDRDSLRSASDWPDHLGRWKRSGSPSRRDRNLPDFAVFSDAPFAPELVALNAGTFRMGSPEDERERYEDEGPQRWVAIEYCFAIGRYPVTFEEYDRFCELTERGKPEDEGWGRGRQPVINVTWHDAQAYVSWLSRETGRRYRLPSEAEWEFACRADTRTRYSFGDAITPHRANYVDSRLERTSRVGEYEPNAWGLYDMHGNVAEWVDDEWHDDYAKAPHDGLAWANLGSTQRAHGVLLRGGSWTSSPGRCRSAYRNRCETIIRNVDMGFRVARTLVTS